ncbi:MAG: response regulator [Spirochaetales bacterium]|nr:response regulator [Spirochaetales bacterium]
MSPTAKILIADDDKRIRTALADVLSTEGYQVRQAGDGSQALAEMERWAPDVVLLDIHMPVMDGLEAIRRIKANPSMSHIPIIIVTGSDDTEARLEGLRLGADEFLLKPPHIAELTVRVRSLVQVKAYHDHLLNYQKELEERVEKRTRELRQTLAALSKANDRLKRSSLNTIYCLSRAAEYKDEETAAHIQRMGDYARVISGQLGGNEEEREMLLYATPMHDIGKIGIPDRILLKPGKLDADEWKIMQQHTTMGAQILTVEANGFLGIARAIALSHHEKWDGSGYPEGLKGEAIPLPGRIAAVADVFDALSSKRPYKQAFSLEESARTVAEGRGSHFDPQVVDAFLAAKDKIFTIRAEHDDAEVSVMIRLSAEQGRDAADP